ncbi:MAG TPA: hypothetical protein VEW03_07940, partial [Longimicrobiaceae bacterium]|nr:hypothetical protein [Longimicrobiaceae bacterium]
AGRTRAELRGQALSYSVGLLDGMSDEEGTRLLGLLHSVLRPGGRAVVASLLPANPCRAYMEHVLEWPARHRDRAAVDALFAASPFGRPATEACMDEGELVVVASCTRD